MANLKLLIILVSTIVVFANGGTAANKTTSGNFCELKPLQFKKYNTF